MDAASSVFASAAREHGARLVATRGRRGATATRFPSRIVRAMRTRPFLVGGTDRFDSVLIEETDGRVVAKIGAEGVHSRRDSGAGDRRSRSRSRTARSARSSRRVLRMLQMLDVLPATLPPRLDEFLRRPVRNTRGEMRRRDSARR